MLIVRTALTDDDFDWSCPLSKSLKAALYVGQRCSNILQNNLPLTTFDVLPIQRAFIRAPQTYALLRGSRLDHSPTGADSIVS